MKKILLVIGLIIIVFLVLNFITIKSTFSHKVSNSEVINIKAGTGNFNFNTSSEKSVVSGYFNHTLLNNTGFTNNSNELDLNTNKANGEIDLPNNINFSNISLVLGAGNLDLNLKGTNINDFSLTSGASNIKLVLPQDTSSKFTFTIGAGNLNAVIPTNGKLDGIKIISQSLSNMNLGSLWVKMPDGIETKDFNKAKVTSIIDLSKGGSVNLDITIEK